MNGETVKLLKQPVSSATSAPPRDLPHTPIGGQDLPVQDRKFLVLIIGVD